jgi:uncharacterized protein YhaN
VRFDSLDLIRFGHFCGDKIELPPRQPDYYLIYGDNEAGKTTLLRAISASLFGVPVNTPDVHSCQGHELRIGVTLSHGRERFSFRRRKGTSGTLLNVNESQIPDEALLRFLPELDRKRFEQLFGLDHQRLREGGEELLRGEGDVGSALFQAAGQLDLRRLLEKLDSEAKEIFSPHSSKRTIARVINEYRQAKAEIGRLAISGTAVKQKQAELESVRAELAKLKDESQILQHDLERLRRIKSNKPDLARLQQLRTALAGLESVPILPAEARRQRDEAAATLATATSQINTLIQEVAQREKRNQELPANRLLIAHESEITELNAKTGSYAQDLGDRVKRATERDKALEGAQEAWKEIWPQPVSEAESLKRAYSSKEEILKLVAECKELTANLRNAEEELENVAQEQQQLQEQLADMPDPADPAALIATIEQAKSLGNTDQAAARLGSQIERLTKDMQRATRKLGLWKGTVEELESLKMPLSVTIEQYAREWEGHAAKRRDLSVRHANVVKAIQEKERELGALTSQISGAGESELAAARRRRDELWELIRASALEKTLSAKEAIKRAGSSSTLAEVFADHLHKTDEIADVRFANASQVVIHDRLVKEIASSRADQQSIEKEREQTEEAERLQVERWNREWSELGTVPLSPAEMKEWLQQRQAILVQLELAREKEDEIQSLQNLARSAAAQIKAKWLELDGDAACEDEPLPVMLRMAEEFAKQRQSERRSRDGIQRQLKLLSVEKRKAKLEKCKERLAKWSQKWEPHVSALRLPQSSTPEQVARALSVLESVFHQLDDAKGLQYRVKRIGDNIEAFEKRVAAVVAAIVPVYASLAPDAAIKELHSQLQELRKAETLRETLQQENERDKAMLANWREQAQQASTTLSNLKALAGARDEQQLEAAIAASEQKAEKQSEYKRIADSLIERNTSADLKQIEQEASEYDLDSLQPEILIKEERSKFALEEMSNAARRCGELTNEFERLESSEESALQMQKAEEALAQLRPAVSQYLRLRLASQVLQQAMESYREKHQEPILRRASALFSRITLGQHSGLTSDFGDNDKPILVAIRNNGEKVHVEGLSDGTRDQMYLALRLAAIEHHVETVAPCPVIFDDLLINSDDSRASAALQVIADLARKTQVLFFTHHTRLVELATKSGAQMIELKPLAAASAVA